MPSMTTSPDPLAAIGDDLIAAEREARAWVTPVPARAAWLEARVTIWFQMARSRGVMTDDNAPRRGVSDLIHLAMRNLLILPALIRLATVHVRKRCVLLAPHRRKWSEASNTDGPVDPYTWPLVQPALARGAFFVAVERTGAKALHADCSGQVVALPSEILMAVALLASRIGVLRPPVGLLSMAERLESALRRLGYSTPVTRIFKRAATHTWLYYRLTRLLIAWTRPTSAVMTDWYSKGCGISAALRERNLEVIETQHGLIAPEHPGFNPPAPRWTLRHLTPSQLALWGPKWGHRCSLATTEIVPDWTPSAPFLLGTTSGQKQQQQPLQVLVISQKAIAKNLAVFCTDLATFLPESVELVVKPHPAEGDLPPWWCKPGRPSLLQADISLTEAICSSTAVIGVYSTGLVQALCRGVPVIIWQAPGWALLGPVGQDPLVHLADSPGSAAAALGDILTRGPTSKGPPNGWIQVNWTPSSQS